MTRTPARRPGIGFGSSAPASSERSMERIGDRADQVDRERIAARAYELYLQRGGSQGGELEDWLAAEREVAPAASRHE